MRRILAPLLGAFLAVGAFAVAIVCSAGPAGADIAWRTQSEIAGSLNTGGNAVINSVSCSSDGNCAAGGYYKDSSGNPQALVVSEVAGVWGTPSEVGDDAEIDSVSCSSARNCAAGGQYRDGSGHSQAFVIDEVMGVWGTPNEVAGTLNTGGDAWVRSVSCSSATSCVAGGFYTDGSGNAQAFVVSEAAGVWGPPSEVAGALNAGGWAWIPSVSCPAPGYCAAGGFYTDGSGSIQAFVVSEVAGVWGTPIEVASSLNTDGVAAIDSVSCSSHGNCTAGGYYEGDSGHSQAFVVSEVAGVWGTARNVAGALNNGDDTGISSISCSSVGNCGAGGQYRDDSGQIQAFVVSEVAGVWGMPNEVAGSLNVGGNAWINSVSCSADGNCAAGGHYQDGSGGTQAFVVDEVAGSWGMPSEVAGSLNVGGNAWINSVSCSADGNCAAGGSYKDGSGGTQALVVSREMVPPSYAVTFSANGGSGTMSAETESAPTALTGNAFTRMSYTFTGWNTAASGSGTAYADRATYPFDADITLYAQWKVEPQPREIMTVHPATVLFGAKVRLRVHLFGRMGTVSGRVKVSFAGKTICSASLANGVTVCLVASSWLGHGRHRLVVKFGGSTYYRPRNKSVFVRVS